MVNVGALVHATIYDLYVMFVRVLVLFVQVKTGTRIQGLDGMKPEELSWRIC